MEDTLKISVLIQADTSNVWEALTNPQLIKLYLFGTEAISDWKVGSPLIFKGIWEGKEYIDKGVILVYHPKWVLKYTYLSSFSGLPDSPENYDTITYELNSKNDESTTLTVYQNHITPERRERASKDWSIVLDKLKEVVEKRVK